MTMRAAGIMLLFAFFAIACAGEPAKPSKYPARDAGCDVQVFPEEPNYSTDNIGPVSASCEASFADADCLRELKDQTCKLGGDTVWGVNDTPTMQTGRKKFFGRAAHRK